MLPIQVTITDGYDSNSIIRIARINLAECKAETKILISELLRSAVLALEVVRDREIHDKLQNMGEEVKSFMEYNGI